MLRTSIVPTMLKAGVGPNVIPSEAEATIDVRALPDENIAQFFAEMTKIIGDPAVKIVPLPIAHPPSPPSSVNTEMYRVLEQVSKKMYPGVDGSSDHDHRIERQGAVARQGHAELRDRSVCE